ncbi:MAG TPA: RHS repeat-associated core domain-containing protein [Cyclobacteriaceae bacterium]|nr:RHS repeat-associated core domain-containing protein [Cyclobacteriaceae bacterium]
MYLYLSNDNAALGGNAVEVFLDDFTVEHIKSPVVQQDDYYAFGLEFNSYQRENATKNNYLYNGKEKQDELDLGWLDYGVRMYMADIGRWVVIDPKAELLEMSSSYVYSLNCPVNFIDRDGELPIFINGRVSKDSERGSSSYWDAELLKTIASSGIPNPGGTIMYVDGDRGVFPNLHEQDGWEFNNLNSLSSRHRTLAGRKAAKLDFAGILEQLERDPKTGKITEKIQIYTHSRGGAFGVGYTEELLKMIKENAGQFANPDDVIEFIYNMAPHQSRNLTAPDGTNSYSHDHNRDKFSDNDMKGLKAAFSSSEKSGGIVGAHSTSSFVKDVKSFLKAFGETKGKDNKKLIKSFVNKMKRDYNVDVTVKQ